MRQWGILFVFGTSPTKALLGEERRWDIVPMSGSQFVALGVGWFRSSPDPACADMAEVLEIYSGRRLLPTLVAILTLPTRARPVCYTHLTLPTTPYV